MSDDDASRTQDTSPDEGLARRVARPALVVAVAIVGAVLTRAFVDAACLAGLLPIQDADPFTGKVVANAAGAVVCWALTVALAWRWGGRVGAAAAGLTVLAITVLPLWSEMPRIADQIERMWQLR